MLSLLNRTLCEIMKQMFSMDFIAQNSNKNNCLPDCEGIMSFIHFNSSDFRGDICLSMSHESCRRMLAQHNLTANSNDFEILMRSTVGEVSNTLAGEFLALPQVRQTFGHVEVHPPIILDDHVKDNPAFPLVQGYCGKIQFDEIEILTFISDNFSSLQESDQYSA